MHWRDIPRPAFVKTLTPDEWRNADLNERFLHVMRSQERLGIREVTENWGPAIKAYLAVAGVFGPGPWCAALVTWALVQAGADRKKLPKFAASTYFWWKWANDNELTIAFPVRGSLGVQNGAKGGHIWAILDGNPRFATIEGNTNPGGSREGYGVFERKRSAASMMGHPRRAFIRLPNSLGVGE